MCKHENMVQRSQVKDTYRLLVDSSPALRQAAAGLVSGLLEELGARVHDQVRARPAVAEVMGILVRIHVNGIQINVSGMTAVWGLLCSHATAQQHVQPDGSIPAEGCLTQHLRGGPSGCLSW